MNEKKIPSALDDKILEKIKNELQPNMLHLLLKVFLIHLVTAVFTLAVCPQFGFKTFNVDINLMHSFMFLGMPFCYLLCGVFFTACSVISASLILKRDEIRALRFQKIASTLLMVLTSVSFFIIMKPELFVEFSIMWLIGAVLGTTLTLEISGRVLAKN